MEESEKFLSAYHIILYLLILIISIYLLLITTSTPTKENVDIKEENVDIKLLLRQKIQYLQKFYPAMLFPLASIQSFFDLISNF